MIRDLIKEILKEELLGLKTKESVKDDQENDSTLIGKIVMVRTYSAGVHFGKLEKKKGQWCLLSEAMRVHYWAKACSLSQLAIEGDKDITNARISMPVNKIELDQVIEVIEMSDEAYKILTSVVWKK
jgi:hypothetical protein